MFPFGLRCKWQHEVVGALERVALTHGNPTYYKSVVFSFSYQ